MATEPSRLPRHRLAGVSSSSFMSSGVFVSLSLFSAGGIERIDTLGVDAQIVDARALAQTVADTLANALADPPAQRRLREQAR